MFVQSHIQRTRYPLGSTTSATAATSASSNTNHNKQATIYHQQNHHQCQHHRRQPHQPNSSIKVGHSKAIKKGASDKRDKQPERPKVSCWTGGSSASGERSNQCNSFFNQHIDQDVADLIRAVEKVDKTGQLIERIRNARDDVELLHQVELVESRLVARQATSQVAPNNELHSPIRSSILAECRERPFVRCTSLMNLNSQTNDNNSNSQRPSFRERSKTINLILKERPQSGTSSTTNESNEKWSQFNESFAHLNCHSQRELTTSPISTKFCLLGGVFYLPRKVWNFCIARAGEPAAGYEAISESPLNIRKKLTAVAWFGLNFLAFQYETLKQIYLVVRATCPRGLHSQSEMAASSSEHVATAPQLNGSNLQYNEANLNFYSHRGQTGNCTIPSLALAEPTEPRLVQHQIEPLACRRNYHEHDHHQPNHVHVHNHAGLANYYNAHKQPPLLECTCFYDAPTPNSPCSMHRPEQCSFPKECLQRDNLQGHNRVGQPNVIAMRQQQEALTNFPEPGWQWLLRHTVDGSACRRPDHYAPCAPFSLPHRADFKSASLSESHRASVSSPTLLELSQQLSSWRKQQLPQLRPEISRSELSHAKPAPLDQWRLGDSSDELSVISDHQEPADRTSFNLSGSEQRLHAFQTHRLPTNRPAQSLSPRRAQYAGLSSMEGAQSTKRVDVQHASSSTDYCATDRLEGQSSLTMGNTSSISGVSISSGVNLHKQPAGKAENTRDGAGSAVESNNQQPQLHQQQTSRRRRRLSPLARVSLAGARRRLGFKRRGGGLNSLSVHRSEEVFPGEVIGAPPAATNQLSSCERRLQYANTTESSSPNHSSLEFAPPSGLARSPWFNQFRSSPDPKVCFVDGLGAGQIASRQALVSPYLGDIQLGLSDRRGMLEVEVIRVRQLQLKPAAKRLPSPYVKVYLMRDKKCLAKFKTRLVRETLDPLYQQQFIFRDDYSNCVLQVIVWGDYCKSDRKSLMGAVQIFVNELDMSKLVIGWYKLFNAPSMMNSSLASSSKALRQTMSSCRLDTDFCPLSSWQTSGATNK